MLLYEDQSIYEKREGLNSDFMIKLRRNKKCFVCLYFYVILSPCLHAPNSFIVILFIVNQSKIY